MTLNLNLNEQRFESDIESWLLQHGGYLPGNQKYFLKDKAVDLSEMIAFISNTQPNEWKRYRRTYLDNAESMLYRRFQEQVEEKGLLSVLRNGIKDRGITLRFVYFQPPSDLNPDLADKYRKNHLVCHRQFAYSPHNHNTIDMVLSLNGIPLVALELKNQFTGQSVENGKAQYKDRKPSELIFHFNKRLLVYFTADLNEVWMTTRLEGDQTRFLPFNQGSGGAGHVGGAGNPPGEGYPTSYLWQQVLKKDNLLALLQRYISLEVPQGQPWRKGKILFPRYHQWDVVEKLTQDVLQKGSGHNYLIQHSAGSGKSNSIAWLTYRLASLHNAQNKHIFHSVFVVTDRRLLNRQLQATVLGFEHQPGMIATVTDNDNSSKLREAIEDGRKIIITTLHRFPLIVSQVEEQRGRRFAVIVDEAHSSQSGTAAQNLRETLADTQQALEEYALIAQSQEEKQPDGEDILLHSLLTQGRHENLSFFGFTATPKPKTLETFGAKQPDGTYRAFHTYSMRQAIEEEFIHDVLRYYTTMENTYAIVKAVPDNPELPETPAVKAIKSYQQGHQDTIARKTAIMVERFRDVTLSKLGGKAKAMVVTASRAHAVKYILAIRAYIKDKGYTDVHPLVAFSGEIQIGGQTYTEPLLNTFEGRSISESQLAEEFATDKYNMLVVAEKYQTGFSESRLHTMFVDKSLHGVKAVQTLSRLNRVYPGKVDTYVLDFVNKAEDIQKSFLPFYEDTFLKEGIDPNLVYTFKDRLDGLHLFGEEEVEAFCRIYLKSGPQTDTDMGALASVLQPTILRYNALQEDMRYEARDALRHFNRAYAYVVQIIRLFDKPLHKTYLFTEYLWRLLPGDPRVTVDLEKKIRLEKNRLEETFSGSLSLSPNQEAGGMNPQGTEQFQRQPDKTELLELIVEKINLLYEGNFTEADRVIVETIYDRLVADNHTLKNFAANTEQQMFTESIFPQEFGKVAQKLYVEQTAAFTKLFQDKSFYNSVMNQMAASIYQGMRNN